MNRILLFSCLFIQLLIHGQVSERSLSAEKWKFKNTRENTWLAAKVPGTVHLDLMNNNLIPDPYKDENEKKVQWVENEDWEYQTVFNLSSQEMQHKNIDLVFLGLDTFSEVHLNGKLVKNTDNMFRTWTIPAKPYLKPGENILRIKFRSAVNAGKELAEKIPFTVPESPRSLVRKAQYQFGWDWGPRLVTAGIWKNVSLRFWDQALLETVKIEQVKLASQKADLAVHTEIFAQEAGKYTISINNRVQDIALKSGINTISVPYQIRNPERWQPNGWGKPTLYDIKIILRKETKMITEKTERIGLRTVELIQEKDEKGKSFYFKVNGRPMYAKGTNWIPGDSFSPRMTREKYQKLIRDCKEAHMNMIRVWGGGIYEDDEFYKACDENGILVWQDFMFAGSFYPADESFRENVDAEAKDQIERLQNHPSLALWCGNNEIDEAIVNWGYQKQFKYSKEDSLQVWKDYRTIFHEAIPEAIRKYATPDRQIYWPSSPSVGWGHKESLTEGDSHYWGVWWGEQPFEIFNEKIPRFASEYGFQGMPTLETVQSMFSGKPELSLKNGTVKAHEKHSRGWEIIDHYMKRDYAVPEDFMKYNYVSQLLQARGMQIAIEAHRRARPYNMGTLYWQLNDCWPVVSWSSIDYLGRWKALHYQVKRSFENQMVLTEEKNSLLNFYAISDELKKEKEDHLSIEIQLMDFNGKVLNKMTTRANKETGNGITEFDAVEMEKLVRGSGKNRVFLRLTLKNSHGKIIAENHHFFAKPKDLKLPPPHIRIRKISAAEIEISTDVLAKDVYLLGDTHFSDNFFDLLPKTSRRITLSEPLEKMEAISLWDTMSN